VPAPERLLAVSPTVLNQPHADPVSPGYGRSTAPIAYGDTADRRRNSARSGGEPRRASGPADSALAVSLAGGELGPGFLGWSVQPVGQGLRGVAVFRRQPRWRQPHPAAGQIERERGVGVSCDLPHEYGLSERGGEPGRGASPRTSTVIAQLERRARRRPSDGLLRVVMSMLTLTDSRSRTVGCFSPACQVGCGWGRPVQVKEVRGDRGNSWVLTPAFCPMRRAPESR